MSANKDHILLESCLIPIQTESQRLSSIEINFLNSITSKKNFKNTIKKGLIRLNGSIASTADFVNGGEIIEVFQSSNSEKTVLNLKIDIIYQDEDIAIVFKPAGLLSSGNKLRTLSHCLGSNLDKKVANDAIFNPQPAHRLDYETSGLMLIGKHNKAIKQLNEKFENHKVDKTYLAVCIGKMEKQGRIESPIEGKDSITEYQVIESIESENYQYLNLVHFKPLTGRTHQIRKHSLYMGNPILGDKQYFDKGKVSYGNGLYLLAYSLQFDHPFGDHRMEFTAPVPKKFYRLFNSLYKHEALI